MSLYRKYRPQTFSEVVGQKHIVATLLGALRSGQIGHAYIFAGPRGTGKTSIARILAKAVNCSSPKDGQPCGACDVCGAIADGNFLDLIEIDAASNRGIDEIRDLKEKIRFAPNIGKYKVYIIDEVHMLTPPAFNALLKTLEEPPSHVMFVLATTEIQKIPMTILSRCQRFDFHKISSVDMLEALRQMADKEKIQIDDKALRQIISLGEGSFRDSLSHLDQVYAFSSGESIDSSLLEDVLGIAQQDKYLAFLELVFNNRTSEGIVMVNDLVDKGIDVEIFVKNTIRLLRHLMLYKINKDMVQQDLVLDDDSVLVVEKFNLDKLISFAELMNEVLKTSKFSFMPQMVLELAIIRFTDSSNDATVAEPIEHVDKEVGVIKESVSDTIESDDGDVEEMVDVAEQDLGPVDNVIDVADGSRDIKENDTGPASFDGKDIFLEKIKEEKPALFMIIKGASISRSDRDVVIGVNNDFYYQLLSEKENNKLISSLAVASFGDGATLKIEKMEVVKKKSDIVEDALSILGGELLS